MPIKYPIAWSNLRYPNIRSELLEYLKSATRPDLYEDTTELEFVVHFFFDDHDFVPTSAHMVGKIFLEEVEAKVVTDFVNALDLAIGPKNKPLSKVTAQDWMPVAAAATNARARLVSSGEPTFG